MAQHTKALAACGSDILSQLTAHQNIGGNCYYRRRRYPFRLCKKYARTPSEWSSGPSKNDEHVSRLNVRREVGLRRKNAVKAGAHMPRDVRHEQRRGIHFLRVQNFDIGGVLLRIVFWVSQSMGKSGRGAGREGGRGAQTKE